MAVPLTSPGWAMSSRERLELELRRVTLRATRTFLREVQNDALVTLEHGGTRLTLGEVLGRWEAVVQAGGAEVARRLKVPANSPQVLATMARWRELPIPTQAQDAVSTVLFSRRPSKTAIKRALSMRTGETYEDVTGKVVQEGADWYDRMVALARSEATIAFNSERLQELAKSAATEVTWVSHHDAATRPTHLAADGQTVRIGTPFIVGGFALNYPGDPLGPIQETAGCRCVLAGASPSPAPAPAPPPSPTVEPSDALATAFDGDTDAWQADLEKEVFAALPGEVEAKVTEITGDASTARLILDFLDPVTGRIVGSAKRIFTRIKGRLSVIHDHLVLESRWQGKGVGSAFNRLMEKRYRAWGVKEIHLDANIDVGGYAWAKAGYDWDPEWTVARAEVLKILATLEPGDQVTRWAADVESKPMEEWPLPYDLAMYGYTPGALEWNGRTVMLKAYWAGRKLL